MGMGNSNRPIGSYFLLAQGRQGGRLQDAVASVAEVQALLMVARHLVSLKLFAH